MSERRTHGGRPHHGLPLAWWCVICLLATNCTGDSAEVPLQLSVLRGAIGEPSDGFPTWAERVVFMLTNRARCDPEAELASCAACAERDCYSPVQPLVWNHGLARSARFHSDNIDLGGCAMELQHDSPCTLVADIATEYTPGPCDGDPSCACSDSYACGNVGTAWNERITLFAGGDTWDKAENIATHWSGDPVDAYELWIYEPDGSASCGFRSTNGHRVNILSGNNRAIGVGRSGGGSVYTQDFRTVGSPDGLVSGSHYPQTGATLEFRASWYRASGPEAARVNIDGVCTDMTLERGTVTNGAYLATVGGLGAGCHQYYFHFTDGAEEVFYPTTGSFGIGCSYDWDPTRPDPCEGCEPDCTGKVCGDDGCGGICGTCSGDTTCNASGRCVCSGGLTNCSSSCVNTNTDPSNCGGCGVTCGADEVCDAGSCECVSDCTGRECGDDGCGGSCGTCTGGMTCDGSFQCTCPTGLDDCGGTCTDLSSDRSHCGDCATACTVGEGCDDGECITDCTPDCTGRECGDDGCGSSCGECEVGLVCDVEGHCGCGDDALDCGDGVCVDPQTDPDNCGGCGTVCGDDESCVDGSCSCLPSCGDRECGDDGCGGTCGTCGDDRLCGSGGQCLCLGALDECDDECVDVRTDESNCGTCGHECLVYEQCLGGACTTDEPDGGCVASCEGRECGDDGCEGSCGECGPEQLCAAGGQCLCTNELTDCGDLCIDVRTDESHCGACDHACLPGQRCVGATCVGEGDAGPTGVKRPPLRLLYGGTDCDCRATGAGLGDRTPWVALLCVSVFGAILFRRR